MSNLLPNIGELIGMIHDYAGPFFNGFFPFLGWIVGIPLAFMAGSAFINLILDKFDWLEEKEDLNYIRDSYRHLLGGKTGSTVFETFRLADELSNKPLDPLKFITPRDWRAGENMFDALGPTLYKRSPYEMHKYPNWGERYMNPNEFKAESHGLRQARENFRRGTHELWNKGKEKLRYARYNRYLNAHPETEAQDFTRSEYKGGHVVSGQELENYMVNLGEDHEGGVQDLGSRPYPS